MRRALCVLVLAAVAVLATATAAGGDGMGRRMTVPAQLSIRVPPGWHVLRGWLSDVADPAPRLALASFPARLSRHTCACGFPNVEAFPRGGAFIFVWEYLRPSRQELVRVPGRPARFQAPPGGNVRHTCDGPTDTFLFKEAGRDFQLEVYLGPRSDRALRASVATALDSLRAAPEA